MKGRWYIPCCYYPQGSGPWTFEIVWRGHEHPTLAAAKREGFEHCGSDDFNIAVVVNHALIEWTWMGEPLDEEPDELAIIASKLGLRAVVKQ